MKIINSGLIHPFLFGLFPILYIFSNNLTEITPDKLWFPVIVIFGAITVFLFILIKISKNIHKATLTTSFLLLLFFSIGHVRNLVFGYEVFNFPLHRPEFLMFMYLIIFIVGLFSIYKIKDLLKPTQIISVVSIAVIISFLPSMVLGTTYDDNKNGFSTQIKFENLERPNIYFIILDQYVNGESLKNDFDFDNSKFRNYLKNLGFIVPENGVSNYAGTALTMTSALNMNYLQVQPGFGLNNNAVEEKVFSNNLVMKTLQDNGYTTIYIDAGGPMREMRVSDKILCRSTDNGLFQTLIDTSVLNYIMRGFFWDSWNKIRTCGYSELEKVQENTKTPFFVYAHLRTPHEPYLRDADGNFVQYEKKARELDLKTGKQRYIYQLEYTNKKMMEIIPKLMSFESKPVIIITSDHGYGEPSLPPTDEEIILRHSTFQAFYLPNIDNYEPYRKMTHVNFFRSIFNDYFETNLEILENKAYWLEFDHNNNIKYSEATDVTDVIYSKNKNP